jgi:hypothetical protein
MNNPSQLQRIRAAEKAADEFIKQAQHLREQASTADDDLRAELLQIADQMEENATLMKNGLRGMRRETQ